MPDELSDNPTPTVEERYKGTPVSPGIAIGPLVLLYADEHIIRKRRIRPEDVAGEITRFEAALLKTRQQIQVPHVTIPVRQGRNLANLVEVAALDQKLKAMGQNSAVEFNERLLKAIANRSQ